MTESLLRKASLSERAVSPARVLLGPHRVSSNLMRVTAFSLGVALALLNETRAEAADSRRPNAFTFANENTDW